MKNFLTVLLTLCTVVVQAQELKQGYSINDKGDTLYGAFKIPDSDEFTTFSYQNEAGNLVELSIKDIQRIVLDEVDYVRSLNVPVDQTPTKVEKLKENTKPIIVQKNLFLRQVVFGEIPLFAFVDDNLKEHFYIKVNGELTELIRRKKLDPGSHGNAFRVIDKYKGQLTYALQGCEKVNPKIQQTQYTLKDISQLLLEYNQCIDGAQEAYLKGINRAQYSFGAIAEVGYINSVLPNIPASANQYSDFSGIGYRVSMEGVADPLQRKMQFAMALGFQQRLLTATGKTSFYTIKDKLTLNQIGLMPSVYFGRKNTSRRLKFAFQLGLRVDMIFVSEKSRVFNFSAEGVPSQRITIPNLNDILYEAGVLAAIVLRKGRYLTALRYLRGGGLVAGASNKPSYSDNISLAFGVQLTQ